MDKRTVIETTLNMINVLHDYFLADEYGDDDIDDGVDADWQIEQIDKAHEIIETLLPEVRVAERRDNELTAYKVKGVLAERTCNALLRAGFYTTEDLTYVTELQIKHIRQIGKAAYEEIQRFCKDYGINIGSNSRKVPSFSKGDIVVSLFDKESYKESLYCKARTISKGTKFEIVEINTQQTDGYFHLPTYLCRLIESDNDMDRAVFNLSQIAKI